MSDQTAPEPTMEEILASIRRIISEDDTPGAAPAEAAAQDDDDDVLELTEAADESHAVSHEEIAAAPEPEPEPEPEPYRFEPRVTAPPAPEPAPEPTPEPRAYEPRTHVEDTPPMASATRDDALISPQTASVAASAFGELSAAAAQPRDSRTLDEIARELLQPMLREWLDANLPRIVEVAVREEVERISRGR